jgi:hypothetical protein
MPIYCPDSLNVAVDVGSAAYDRNLFNFVVLDSLQLSGLYFLAVDAPTDHILIFKVVDVVQSKISFIFVILIPCYLFYRHEFFYIPVAFFNV